MVAIDSAVPRREVAPPPPFSPYGSSPPPEVLAAFPLPPFTAPPSQKTDRWEKNSIATKEIIHVYL